MRDITAFVIGQFKKKYYGSEFSQPVPSRPFGKDRLVTVEVGSKGKVIRSGLF